MTTARRRPTVGDLPPSERLCMCQDGLPLTRARSLVRGNVLLRSAACSLISSKFSARVLRVHSGENFSRAGRTITQSGKPSSAAMVVNVMVCSCPSRSLTRMAAPSLPCPILNSAAGTSAIATPATDSLNISFWGVLQTWRNSPAVLPSKLRDAKQSRIQSGVKHRGGSAVQKRVCGRSQQNQGSQGTHCRGEQG